ncbi:L,D-transpeptidase family protein [Photobacterium damselae]|uniref:L,D-transpeptidase family protein n=1 Tax=Photobacterium damselae TaxID=38293 RepID=UPI000D896B44|nr:L,D-transpeptidase family protein [Photobacterium damselae]EHA1079524.1 L,D-transpeptidase family protein [Photobacterium damselae]ELI6448529.1 L,D-transpeptidase family protein [Photobacterium damselae]ELV7517011.1 L,D-transpeptidase family protein [Photobacterium damselae]MBA5682040.1 L,D-transpeptidase family protein [Photobacterium damselae subsp. damselae]MCG3811089.1 L,D-transpeptidase family protein [Photobacterium damselae]
MLNHKRVVTQRAGKLLALSLVFPGSAFATEAFTPVTTNESSTAVTAPEVSAAPQVSEERPAPLTQGNVNWSYLDNANIHSTKTLCATAVSNVCFTQSIEQAYVDNKFYPLWEEASLRKEFEQQLQAVVDSGLLPGMDQRLQELRNLEQHKDMRAYDLLATDTYFVYQAFEQYIKTHRNQLFTTKPINMSKEMSSYVSNEKAFPMTLARLEQQRPANVNFEATMQAIAKFQALEPNPLKASYLPAVYRKGDRIPHGKAVARVLYDLGDLDQANYDKLMAAKSISNTGVMNDAIKHFQKRYGLSADGIIGKSTAQQLAIPYGELARRLALNMQRANVIAPFAKDKAHILVNIPDYMLKVYENGKVVFDSKVIVGRESRPTNLFSSSINTMVVNPYWNVPITIKQKDVIPKAKRNPGYLAAHNIKVINSWRDRTEIPVSSINWSAVNPKSFPHEFQQGPGPHNSLGMVKFLMPNDYAIFLHDTPARGLFSKTKRDLSSGCVRVARAHDLADFVLDYQNRPSMRTFDSMRKDKGQDTVSLSRRIGVDFVYLTGWVNKDGQVQMREDIYNYDTPSGKKIQSKFITMKDFNHRR